jgi:hypothetical protein
MNDKRCLFCDSPLVGDGDANRYYCNDDCYNNRKKITGINKYRDQKAELESFHELMQALHFALKITKN